MTFRQVSDMPEPLPGRRPRFERAATRGFHLTPRDLDLIRAVAAHRFLRSTHLIALAGGSPQKILRRLHLLYHHGYLDRPRMQLNFYERGSEPMVYALGNHGADLLGKEDVVPRGKLNWSAKNRSLTRAFLRHTLLIADFMVGLEVGCRALGRVRVITSEEVLRQSTEETQKQKHPWRWNVRIRGEGEPIDLGVIPDQVFGLRFEDEPEGRNRAFFFLEADRGSMPIARRGLRETSVYRKLLAYQETWRQGLHTAYFGMKHFRLLTVTTTPTRVRHLLAASASLPGGGSPLLLFADQKSLQSGNPLTHLWINGLGEPARLTD